MDRAQRLRLILQGLIWAWIYRHAAAGKYFLSVTIEVNLGHSKSRNPNIKHQKAQRFAKFAYEADLASSGCTKGTGELQTWNELELTSLANHCKINRIKKTCEKGLLEKEIINQAASREHFSALVNERDNVENHDFMTVKT